MYFSILELISFLYSTSKQIFYYLQVVKAFVVLTEAYKHFNRENLIKELQEHTKNITAPYKYPRKVRKKEKNKIENFNYVKVAFISYKLTMWDLMLFSDGHKASWPTSKKNRHLK